MADNDFCFEDCLRIVHEIFPDKTSEEVRQICSDLYRQGVDPRAFKASQDALNDSDGNLSDHDDTSFYDPATFVNIPEGDKDGESRRNPEFF